ncbi:MAG TPA: NHL repeat-containing protein [Bacteroidota bacterium]|nr:NHL repeat-containing protein [Bacteroidota bacterium]
MEPLLAVIFIADFFSPFPQSPADTLFVEQNAFGVFQHAAKMALLPGGGFLVLDAGANAVIRYDRSFNEESRVGGFGWGETSFDHPSGLTTDGLNVYVSDEGNHRIQRFDRFLRFVSSLSTRDTTYPPARFGYPAGVALSPDGDLFILDGENLRVVVFDAGSTYERTFGDASSNNQQFRKPFKIQCVGRRIYIGDSDRILQFDLFGNPLRVFGPGVSTGFVSFCANDSCVVAATADSLIWFSTDGAPRNSVPIASIISDVPLHPVQDIALDRTTLYLLTPEKLVSFDIEPASTSKER